VADYFDAVIHIFTPKTREYYALERLWSDAKRVE
jgi:ribosome-associated protein